MLPQILMWVVLALCITIGFSLFFTVIMPGHVALGDDIGWPAFATFWALLGEFDVQSVTTYVPAHTLEPSSTLVPFFLWLYCFIATVRLSAMARGHPRTPVSFTLGCPPTLALTRPDFDSRRWLAQVILVNLLIAQMSSIYDQVLERSAEFWTFSYLSSTVLEYKDTRNIFPAPLNVFGLLLMPFRPLARAVSAWLYGPLSMREAAGTVREGFAWDGGGTTQMERLAEGRRHRRKQQSMCAKYMRTVEDEAARSIEAQVSLITEKQADMEAKSDQRLESLAAGISSLKESFLREGLISCACGR